MTKLTVISTHPVIRARASFHFVDVDGEIFVAQDRGDWQPACNAPDVANHLADWVESIGVLAPILRWPLRKPVDPPRAA